MLKDAIISNRWNKTQNPFLFIYYMGDKMKNINLKVDLLDYAVKIKNNQVIIYDLNRQRWLCSYSAKAINKLIFHVHGRFKQTFKLLNKR